VLLVLKGRYFVTTCIKRILLQESAIVAVMEVYSVYKVHTPTNALFFKLDEVLKFTLKITV